MNSLHASIKSDNSLVTVVIPAYNHAAYVVEAMESVRGQTYQDWKMIVIDDGSTDDTWQIIQDYRKRVDDPRIQILKQKNKGSHATINLGMTLANTPFIAILNSDDIYLPTRLSELMAIATEARNPVFIVTGAILIDENSRDITTLHWWQAMYRDIVSRWDSFVAAQVENPAVQTLLWGNFTISTSNFFMSRTVWEQIGAFKHLRYVPDWDYALRVAAEMPNSFIFKPEESLLKYRLHGRNTILRGALRNHAEAARVLREFQKKWVASGHQLSAPAITRLHYLTRFIRHEHARQALERQKADWVEQVRAVTADLDRVKAQGEEQRATARAWQQQAEQQHATAQAWQQQVELMQASHSWQLTAPLRLGKQRLSTSVLAVKQLATRAINRFRRVRVSTASDYDEWLKSESRMLERVRANLTNTLTSLVEKPLISVVMPVCNTPTAHLSAAVSSVQSQWYPNWELCICDDASDSPDTLKLLKKIVKADSRIKLTHRQTSGHIVLATNDAIALARGQYIAFLDHDDELAPHALLCLVQKINQEPEVDLLYSDEDKLNEKGHRCLPLFKPDWSPVLQWSQNYIGHLMCVRTSLLSEIGMLADGTQGSQDHDLVLRLAAHGAKIVHIPQVLYHWRLHSASTSSNPNAKPYAHMAGKESVGRHLQKRYAEQFDRVDDSDYAFVYLPRFKITPDTLATIIIPTLDKADLLKNCIESIHSASNHVRYEILVLDNGSSEVETKYYFSHLASDSRVRVIAVPIPFNWSRLNNIGRQHAKGEVLVFLNNDTIVISPDWLQRLMEYALLPDVATVGPLLLYPDNTIQHAGVVVGMGGWADHVFKGQSVTHYPSPFISSQLPRNVLANTGACVAISTQHFDALGGFDESFEICGSDVELGIRAHQQGYSNVYLPSVRLYHLESKTRTSFVPEVDFQQSALKYAPYRTDGDPFFNPNLNLHISSPVPLYPQSGGIGE